MPRSIVKEQFVRILVIESNRDVLSNTIDYLERSGYLVDCAQDGATGLHLASSGLHDLVVLHDTLPAIDGCEICRRLREEVCSDVPIIMVTAGNDLEARIKGLGTGADDCLPCPYAMPELQARIEAILRRVQGSRQHTLQVGDLCFDLDRMRVSRAGQPIQLPRICQKILLILMKKSPAVVSKDAMEQALWGDEVPDNTALRSHIHYLRQMIDKPFEKPLLHTMVGVGYSLAEHANIRSNLAAHRSQPELA